MSSRSVLITGAASGIGLAMAEAFAAAGHHLMLADLEQSDGAAVAQRLNAAFCAADLARARDCSRLIDATMGQFGRIDILINNAGLQRVSPIEGFADEDWDHLIAVMLNAPFRLIRGAWPSMKARGWGRIINIASIHALVASPNKAAYVAAKHGLLGLTRTAALEGGAHGITVNALCPAYVRTPLVENQMADQARIHGLPEEAVIERVMLEPAAIKRLIEPAEVAALALYLCSDAAASISGAALPVDGAWTAR
jgi:3-hydroxybutyrate dehydrogenase